jgi:hypothetical protein
MDERVAACRLFLQDYAFHLNDLDFVVDSIENKFESAYASWPFRFWILTPSRVLFKAMPKGDRYDLNDLEIFLKKNIIVNDGTFMASIDVEWFLAEE